MNRPWRYWFTGGIAAVFAAASQAQVPQDVRSARSPWSVEETVERISDEARRAGVPVLARVPAPASMRGTLPVFLLVLGSDEAHTPVLQAGRGAALALPLTLRVYRLEDGGVDVAFTDPDWLERFEGFEGLEAHDGLPPELLQRVAALPALVEAALAARVQARA